MRRQGCGQSADSRCKGRCVLMNRFRFLPSYHFADSTDGIIQNPAELTLRDYTITGSEGGVGDCAEKRSDIPSGYKQLSYIESTGTQYIDTGLKMNDIFGCDIRYQSTGKANSTYGLDGVFGCNGAKTATGANVDLKLWFSYGQYGTRINAMLRNGSEKSYVNPITSFDEYYATTHHIQWKTDGTVWYNGENVHQLDGPYDTTENYNIFMFRANPGATPANKFYSKTRMYYLKFCAQDGALLRDFVPCKRVSDGVPGMYDAVSGTFFTNKGTGTFLSAPLTYTIPILNNGTKVAEIIRSAPLYAGDSISYRGDGLPAVSLSSGSNALTIGTAVQPGSVTYRYDTYGLLPSGYERLSYIESTGTQYIDTGIQRCACAAIR